MAPTQRTFIVVSLLIAIFLLPSKGDYKQDSKGLKASGGEDHTLVLTLDKGVWASGANGGYEHPVEYYWGVLGTGNSNYQYDQRTLVRVHGPNDLNYLEDIEEIDAGWKHSLALDVNGFVWSWGWSSQGQLGVDVGGPGAYSATPVEVLRGGQPDDPSQPSAYLKHIIAISAGRSGEHSLAVDVNNLVYAWGRNEEGQCGKRESGTGFRELVPVCVLRGEQPQDPTDPCDLLTRIIDVSAGERHSMGLEGYDAADANLDGRVYTWGDDDFFYGGSGVLGVGDAVGDSNTPVCVHRGEQDYNEANQIYLKHIIAISAGWDHSMALEKDDPYDPNLNGRVYTWGNNGQGWGGGPDGQPWEQSVGGRLGNGTYTDSNVPVLVLAGEQYPPDPNSPLEHIIAISAGEGHSMALDANGYVYCWGDNQYGQLGDETNVPSTTPVRVLNPQDPNLPLSRIVAISAGHWHSLAIDANGTIWTWGKGSAGRLGLGNKPIDCNMPHPIPVVYNITQETFAFAIQTAIDDANDAGDTLEASPGTYYENVNFRDKSVTLRSAEPGDPNVVADTVVDAAYNSGSEYHFYQAVDFNDGSGSTLAGLTLMNAPGGGVLCEDVDSVSIVNCSIQNNDCDGIYLDGSSVSITGCEIRANASNEAYEYCGVYCISGSDLNIVNCIVADNDGNGISCKDSSLRVTNSMIEDNADYGIYEHNPTVASLIANNIIRGNADNGIFSGPFSSGPQIKNNWIFSNGGSGIETYNPSAAPDTNAVIVNNTIVNNDANGIKSDYAADVNITNCIIWDSGTNELYAGDTETFDVTYSCIEGGYTGTGNISSDPCFVDDVNDDYHLTWDSNCVDTGDPNFVEDANETDIDGNPRIMGGRVDMGADEDFPHCDPNYPDWVSFGRPNCWMWPYQCDGDADGINSGAPFYYRVYTGDMALIIQNWRKKMGAPGLNPCADIDHISSGAPNYYRVYTGDMYRIITNWRKKPGTPPTGLAGDCVDRACRRGALGGGRAGTQLTGKELLDWLAEIWLDPEVQKAIDEDAWRRVLESLKKEWDAGI